MPWQAAEASELPSNNASIGPQGGQEHATGGHDLPLRPQLRASRCSMTCNDLAVSGKRNS
jgi:hypothetical protein